MSTDDIADVLNITAKLMELHEENPFKIRSLSNAAFKLSKTNVSLDGLSQQELEKIDGIGKSIAVKIVEMQQTGTTSELTALMEKTPKGVVEMLGVKGIGPKKVGQLWRELHIESVGELLYACMENRLVDLKGFGTKTQEAVKKAIEFKQANAGKYHFATVEEFSNNLVDKLKRELHTDQVSLCGEIRRKCEIIDKIEILTASEKKVEIGNLKLEINIPVEIHYCSKEEYAYRLVQHSASEKHLELINFTSLAVKPYADETAVYKDLQLPYMEPELREGFMEVELAKKNSLPKLVAYSDLKGILHNHSTYSDGMNTLEEMARHCKNLGYEYFGICDHSKSAFYANGLDEERVWQQQTEIDKLNEKMAPFRIFKGIESDILNDGSLDYDDDVLATFDFIVASVHSNLKMDEEKATSRLIKAVENPFTTILGHPTGRLLLGRPGYPINHKKVIDACAANGVIVELNAHPYRLDIDWRWIPYCIEKGVMISVNPDAHEKQGFHDMYYGICSARKGMLTKEMCFNAFTLDEIDNYFMNARR
jgi:DNA polymerase (family 10)